MSTVQKKTPLNITAFYIPVPPTPVGGPVSVYDQHLTHLSNIKRRETRERPLCQTWQNKYPLKNVE